MYSVIRERLFRATTPQPEKRLPARGRESAGLVLRLLRTEIAFDPTDDLKRVFRHRYVLLHYLGFGAPVLLAMLVLSPVAATHLPHLPPVTLGVVAIVLTLSAYVTIVHKLLRRWTGSNVVLLSPGFLLAAPMLLISSHYIGFVMGMQGHWTALRALPMLFGLLIYLEVAGTIILKGPIPRAVAQLRAEQKALKATAAPLVILAKSELPNETPDQDDGEEELPSELRDLLRIQAQGNYVLVVTERGRHMVPGPFSARVAKLPARQGRQVHRSHWVASRAVVDIRCSGRHCVIKTVDGAKIPVAVGQIAEIKKWAASAVPVRVQTTPRAAGHPRANSEARSGR